VNLYILRIIRKILIEWSMAGFPTTQFMLKSEWTILKYKKALLKMVENPVFAGFKICKHMEG